MTENLSNIEKNFMRPIEVSIMDSEDKIAEEQYKRYWYGKFHQYNMERKHFKQFKLYFYLIPEFFVSLFYTVKFLLFYPFRKKTREQLLEMKPILSSNRYNPLHEIKKQIKDEPGLDISRLVPWLGAEHVNKFELERVKKTNGESSKEKYMEVSVPNNNAYVRGL